MSVPFEIYGQPQFTLAQIKSDIYYLFYVVATLLSLIGKSIQKCQIMKNFCMLLDINLNRGTFIHSRSVSQLVIIVCPPGPKGAV
jgi:hypothetical protein